MNAPVCSCITCSDQAIEMEVLRFDPETGLARCIDPEGAESDVDTGLVEPVGPGTRVMVHAGAAIALAPVETAA